MDTDDLLIGSEENCEELLKELEEKDEQFISQSVFQDMFIPSEEEMEIIHCIKYESLKSHHEILGLPEVFDECWKRQK
jgi:hypothetical protein